VREVFQGIAAFAASFLIFSPSDFVIMMNREETVAFLDAYFAALEKGEIDKIPLAPEVTLAGPMVGAIQGQAAVKAILVLVSQSFKKKITIRAGNRTPVR
jgi:hypothetical protein